MWPHQHIYILSIYTFCVDACMCVRTRVCMNGCIPVHACVSTAQEAAQEGVASSKLARLLYQQARGAEATPLLVL